MLFLKLAKAILKPIQKCHRANRMLLSSPFAYYAYSALKISAIVRVQVPLSLLFSTDKVVKVRMKATSTHHCRESNSLIQNEQLNCNVKLTKKCTRN